MCRRLARVAAVVWLFVAGSGGVAAGPLTYSGSLQYATGRYTLEDRTQSVYLFNGLRWAAGRWGLQVNLPLVLQSPSGTAVPMTSTAGVGDAFLRVDRQIVDLRGRLPSIRLSAELKAPLSRMHASFGTGEWDVGGGVSLADRIGPGFVFVDATYWKFGDPPGIDLRDAVAYGVAVGRPFGRLGILASVTGYSALVAGIDPPVQAGLYLSWWGSSRRSLSVGTVFGLTDAAPDVGLSAGWHVGI